MLYFDKKNTIWIRGSDGSSDCNMSKHEYQEYLPMLEIIANHGEAPTIYQDYNPSYLANLKN